MKRLAVVVLPFVAVFAVLGVTLLVTRFHPISFRGRHATAPVVEKEEAPE